MRLFDIIPLARIPAALPQVLSYFSGQNLPNGALVQIPLGRRKEEGVVVGAHDIADYKMEIKSADFELRNISKILSAKPVLTAKQIELALFLGQYYFCSPGIFIKMCLPPKNTLIRHSERSEESLANARPKKQTLILAPTIAQAEKISTGYKNAVLWHSGLKNKQLKESWQKIKTGQVQTIIGTRSAVFLPFNGLKEIIIEDETNPNHKSWDMFPHYDSHIIAQKLAEIFRCKVIYKDFGHPERSEGSKKDSSANKSHAVRVREFKPTIVDMREELKDGNFSIFSVDLYEAAKDALAENKQVILFINRRGAANFVLCRDCGYVANCPNCDSPMAYHLINNRPSLFCHHCGAKDILPKLCPKCKNWRIKTVGSGSQKVEAETKKFFPDAKISRLDSDSAPKPKDQQKIIADFIDKKIDVLITTQIIFSWLEELAAAKPQVVGILSADTLLHLPDFRSGEQTFQTIRALQSLQNNAPRPAAAGLPPLKLRGGEGELSQNNFIIQTYNPENSVLKYIRDNDRKGFIQEENETRQALNYPPFSQIVKLTFRHRDADKAGQEAKILAAKLNNALPSLSVIPAPHQVRGKLETGIQALTLESGSRVKPGMTNNKYADNIEISTALPAFNPRSRGKFVWNIIIKFLSAAAPSFSKGGLGRIFTTSEFLQKRNSVLQYVPQNWEIDVDPENLL
ncbi:MAG: primosomal protein N' [Candidatus Portnoybacteria bacterium]|nr:primosomal protein N' [Candidatus Portnoybacteria bacterium]MDD4983073.1 primosomal protein N' [Candidatus Portnoybacteria bacterium]